MAKVTNKNSDKNTDSKTIIKKSTKKESIDENLSDNVSLVVEPDEEIKEEISMKSLYMSYVNDKEPYCIYLNGSVIYDSINYQQKPVFEDKGFYLFNRYYIYRGIRIEKIKKS